MTEKNTPVAPAPTMPDTEALLPTAEAKALRFRTALLTVADKHTMERCVADGKRDGNKVGNDLLKSTGDYTTGQLATMAHNLVHGKLTI